MKVVTLASRAIRAAATVPRAYAMAAPAQFEAGTTTRGATSRDGGGTSDERDREGDEMRGGRVLPDSLTCKVI
jgi:hypothetical protein